MASKQKNNTEEIPAKKPSGQILYEQVNEATDSLDRPFWRLFNSGLSAGLDLGFSVFLMAIAYTLIADVWPEPLVKLLTASMYTFGFVIVILGRSELFTEQTTLSVMPVLSGQASVRELLRLWVVVYVANLIGATLFAALVSWVGPALGVADAKAFGEIANYLVVHSSLVMFAGALLAGWLMGLLLWLVAAGRDTTSQIIIVWLITGAIGLGHLPHVVVGTTEVLTGVFLQQGVTLAEFGHFLLWTTFGNTVGGVVFVALIKYAHSGPQQRQVKNIPRR